MIILGQIYLLAFLTFAPTNSARSQESTLTKLQGEWISNSDSLYSISVKNDLWISKYNGEFDSSAKFQITLLDSLPRFVDKTVDGEFLRLTNSTDTLHFEIFGINSTNLSLMYYPRMSLQSFKRK